MLVIVTDAVKSIEILGYVTVDFLQNLAGGFSQTAVKKTSCF